MFVAFALALAWGCTSAAPPAEEPPRAPQTVLARVPERVVILPFNVMTPMPAELESGSPAVWNALTSYLRAHGTELKTLSFPVARGMWLTSIRDARAAATEKKQAGFEDATRIFVAKLKPYAEFDAVIAPALFVQRAALSGTSASWDGAQQTLEVVDASNHSVSLSPDVPIQGAAPAVSLYAVVLGPEGAKLQETRTGLVLLVRARISRTGGSEPKFDFVPRRDPFADRELLTQGISKGLAPFLPPLPSSASDSADPREPG